MNVDAKLQEALGQFLAEGLNQLLPSVRQKVAELLMAGAEITVVAKPEFNVIEGYLTSPDGQAVRLFSLQPPVQ